MLENGEFLRGAADAGELQVDPDEAGAAVQKLGAVKDNLQALLNTMQYGGTGKELQLGANTVGWAMADKSHSKTNGGESLRAAVELLLTQATNAHYAVSRAMENYVHTDEGGANLLRPQRH